MSIRPELFAGSRIKITVVGEDQEFRSWAPTAVDRIIPIYPYRDVLDRPISFQTPYGSKIEAITDTFEIRGNNTSILTMYVRSPLVEFRGSSRNRVEPYHTFYGISNKAAYDLYLSTRRRFISSIPEYDVGVSYFQGSGVYGSYQPIFSSIVSDYDPVRQRELYIVYLRELSSDYENHPIHLTVDGKDSLYYLNRIDIDSSGYYLPYGISKGTSNYYHRNNANWTKLQQDEEIWSAGYQRVQFYLTPSEASRVVRTTTDAIDFYIVTTPERVDADNVTQIAVPRPYPNLVATTTPFIEEVNALVTSYVQRSQVVGNGGIQLLNPTQILTVEFGMFPGLHNSVFNRAVVFGQNYRTDSVIRKDNKTIIASLVRDF